VESLLDLEGEVVNRVGVVDGVVEVEGVIEGVVEGEDGSLEDYVDERDPEVQPWLVH
jgi:hypothetical protein